MSSPHQRGKPGDGNIRTRFKRPGLKKCHKIYFLDFGFYIGSRIDDMTTQNKGITSTIF